MENLLTKSFIKVNSVLWIGFCFMIFMLLNGIAINSVINETSAVDLNRILLYLKTHIIHLFLIGSSFFLVLTASKKLILSYTSLFLMLFFEMISYVFVNFDKFIIFNIFIFFIISFYFFHVLNAELKSSYYIKKTSDSLMRNKQLVDISGSFNSDKDYSFTLTNWDEKGFFAKVEKLPDSFNQVEIQFNEIKIVLESIEVYYFDKNQLFIGCKVNDKIWGKFVNKLNSFGLMPDFIR